MSTALDNPAGPFSRIAAVASAVVDLLVQGLIVRPLHGLATSWIRGRLAGYKVRVNTIDTLRRTRLPEGEPRSVAVIGGGLAGMTTAILLAERGFRVTLLEREQHLGGKLGAWTHTFADGSQVGMEHGFHAFFPAYYNLFRLFGRLGITESLRRVSDYRILLLDGSEMRFDDAEPTPLLNLLRLVWNGTFDWREFVISPQHVLLRALLDYDRADTYAAWDRTSFDTFAKRHRLPDRMRVMFTIFARTFFARGDQMSMAALLQSFHLYYTSIASGLLYSYATDDHGRTVLAPLRRHMEALGIDLRMGAQASQITRQADRRLAVDGAPYDHVVLAVDARPAHAVLQASPVGREAPGLVSDLAMLRPQNRYANLRVWLDADARPDLPPFTGTEHRRALDAICFYHRCEEESAAWVRERGGAVLELHAYQLPDDLTDEAAIRDALLDDLRHFVPELRDANVVREILLVRDDFSSPLVGQEAHRPGCNPGVDGLYLAGDWVRTGVPGKLMEGAVTSAILAVNAICDVEELRGEPVYSVPLRGLWRGNRDAARPVR
ncbi:MAG TPA: FAD-dependent oxidoreductase [Myxococcota bacterium]|nr:FAD-dependent oxidoreductase [Myxococcota bacterium]